MRLIKVCPPPAPVFTNVTSALTSDRIALSMPTTPVKPVWATVSAPPGALAVLNPSTVAWSTDQFTIARAAIGVSWAARIRSISAWCTAGVVPLAGGGGNLTAVSASP